MAEKCCKTVHGRDFLSYECSRKAKVKRGGRFYCSQHDPEVVKAKRKAADAAFAVKWETEQRRLQEAEERQAELLRKAALAGELAAMLQDFMRYWESDFFKVTSQAEDGRVLADWVCKVAAALAKHEGQG